MKLFLRLSCLLLLGICIGFTPTVLAQGEDGYRLWLRYDPIADTDVRMTYQKQLARVVVLGNSPTMSVVRQELERGLGGLLDHKSQMHVQAGDAQLIVGAYSPTSALSEVLAPHEIEGLGTEGYLILSKQVRDQNVIIVAAQHDVGVLYGTFHLLRLMQTHQDLNSLQIRTTPRIELRILNHWDNLDRTVERGYAGFSIWNWHQLPDYLDPRYVDYARANASIGINGTVLTNVNANALVLRPDYLEKVKALADLFRPYGIRVFLTARFSAPMDLGGLSTADPLNDEVQQWWKDKAAEIYALIPDFGGFLVKANSEGQPGPQNYDRTHADGANMLADAVGPYNGIVMWRAFVYSDEEPEDRHKQANLEFEPLDGDFRDNVLIQVKNGAIDFQPREPFHPLFGALRKTPLMMEFQITQEYLGQGTHLVYLGTFWEEVLKSDTYAKGLGSTVAQVIDGSLNRQRVTAMAGVSNIGTDRNWTSHPFAQANWYAFGRLAWDHLQSAGAIAEEWIRMTFSNQPEELAIIKEIMMSSHQATVNYMTPLGLHHIMGAGHHYGPGPWVSRMSRADWTSVYYHRADSLGIGFDRTESGTDAVSQYQRQVAKLFADPTTCPEEYLLWFHHLPWDYQLADGNLLWDEICLRYQQGVEQVESYLAKWEQLEDGIDQLRFNHVHALLQIQRNEARWWRDACIAYFRTFHDLPLPAGVPEPAHDLEYYQSLQYPYAPGIRPRW